MTGWQIEICICNVVERSKTIPVAPPSINPFGNKFGNKNPFSPNVADKIPRMQYIIDRNKR